MLRNVLINKKITYNEKRNCNISSNSDKLSVNDILYAAYVFEWLSESRDRGQSTSYHHYRLVSWSLWPWSGYRKEKKRDVMSLKVKGHTGPLT